MKPLQTNNVFTGINRSDWETFSFGDIAFNISERVNPGDVDSEIYVGLEHLDPDSIHIYRKGIASDVKGTKLRVYKGDVIFGKRRAYQRKAAVADFNGICSAHAMVIRANPKNVDPDFFPFFLHSDTFMNRAIEISEGSLSPTIKWKILKEQKFRLPPRAIQKKLYGLLLAADDAEQKKINLKNDLQKFKNVLVDNLLTRGVGRNSFIKTKLGDIPKNWSIVHLGECCKSIQYGFTASATGKDVGPKFLRITDIQNNAVDWGSVPYCKCAEVSKYKLEDDDIVFARTGATTGKSYLIKNPPLAVFASYLIRVRVGERFEPQFIYSFFQSSAYWKQIQSLTSGSAQGGFNASKLANLQIVLPSREEQVEIVRILSKMEDNILQNNAAIDADRILKQSIINSFL